MFTTAWFRDMFERALATFLEGLLAVLTVGTTINVSTLQAAGVAGLMAALAVVKASLATLYGDKGTASLDPKLVTLQEGDFETVEEGTDA